MDAMVAISMATMSIFINGESVLEIAIQTRWRNSQLSQLPRRLGVSFEYMGQL